MFFTIITCTYNSEKLVQKNIDSVINQNFDDYEHLFIDGYSNDNTEKIIEIYRKKNPQRVKLIQKKARGISHAMNQGIKNAQGKYLIHLHSDDSFYSKDVLTKVQDFLKTNNYPDWIYGKACIIEENGVKIGIFPNKKIMHLGDSYISKYFLKYFNFISHQAVFIKKNCFDKYGYFDENMKSAMDSDMWLRIKNSTNWLFFNKIICNYVIRADAQSSGKKNQARNLSNYLKVQRKNMNIFEFQIAKLFNMLKNKINKTLR
ncbi:MAG: glycosyltransferase family 2 protein [Patescibacteria group bacterium]